MSRSENALPCNKKSAAGARPGLTWSLGAGQELPITGPRNRSGGGCRRAERGEREQVRVAVMTSRVQVRRGGLSACLPGSTWAARLTRPESGRDTEWARAQGFRVGGSTKRSPSCSAGGRGAPMALRPEGGAALRRGLGAAPSPPLKPKGDSHCVQSQPGPCGLCCGTKLRLDQTESPALEAWSPWVPRLRDPGGSCEPSCRLPAHPPNPGVPRKPPKGNSGGPSRGRTPCGHS